MKTLQSQIEKHEQELEQFELVKSDWQMEKQALEGVLKKLRQELREKEGELCIVQARKVATTLSSRKSRLSNRRTGVFPVVKNYDFLESVS